MGKAGGKKSRTGRLIALGVVARPHGIKGELKIHPYNPRTETIPSLKYLFLCPRAGAPRKYLVAQIRPMQGDYLVRLEGVVDRNGSEELRGMEVLAEERQFKECGEGEYYWYQLIGLKAALPSGEVVGEVVRLEETNPALGGHDVLVVSCGGKELLLPFTGRVVKKVDLPNGRIVVEGLEEFQT